MHPQAHEVTKLLHAWSQGDQTATQPNDPGTLALAGVVLLSAAILAGYVPARRASRIDPPAALRQE